MTDARPATLHALLDRVADRTDPFVAARGQGLDGVGFAQAARRFAGALQAAGVAPGDRVAAFVEHGVEQALVPFACALAGAVSVIVNPRLRPLQLRHVVDDCGARLVWTTGAKLAALPDQAAAFGARPVFVAGESTHAGVAAFATDREFDPVPVRPADAATILYTSGSTGRPKGIVQSHQSLVDGARIVAGYLGLDAHDHVLGVLPLSFDYGLNQVLAAAWSGARVTLLQYLFAGEVVRAVRDLGCTGLAGVPEVWVDVVGAAERGDVPALASLRYVTNSGGRLPERVIRFFHERLPQVQVFSMYGLTEAFRSSFVPPAELAARPRSIGRAMPEVELLVVDPHDGHVCAPGEVGELVHCGACVAHGYWNAPDATAARFRPHPRTGVGTCVWSGDLARCDADGYLELVGRADAQIKVGGYRVAPDEIVAVVRDVAGVRSAAAVGVPRGPDGLTALCVAIEAAPDADVAALPAAVRDACAAALPPWMVPAEVRVVAALPRNPNEKVDLAAVRAVFEAEVR